LFASPLPRQGEISMPDVSHITTVRRLCRYR
jgi:hypothetical protein